MNQALKISMFLMVALLTSCVDRKKNYEDCHHYMTIINNSDFVIYVSGSFLYPDTVDFATRDMSYVPNPIFQPELKKVNPHGENTDAIFLHDACLETRIRSKICPSDTMMVFLFREDSLLANDWKDAPNFVLKRYDLTIDDLNALNWTITYP